MYPSHRADILNKILHIAWVKQQKYIPHGLESEKIPACVRGFLGKSLFLDYRWLLCPHMAFPMCISTERESKFSGVLSDYGPM